MSTQLNQGPILERPPCHQWHW